MTNPQHIEGLTAKQIATYRERMENPRPGGNAGLPEMIDVPTFLATLDRMLATERQKVLDEVDAAIGRLVDKSDCMISVGKYSNDTDIVCVSDERLAGQFIVAGRSYTACILRSAAEPATVKRRSEIVEESFALVKAARAAKNQTNGGNGDG